jgi:histidinol dehydrogenase
MINITRIVGDFDEAKFKEVISRPLFADEEIARLVAEIVRTVRERGDQALLEYTKKFDGVDLSSDTLRVSEEERQEAYAKISKEFLSALRAAERNIFSFHRKKLSKSWSYSKEGIVLGQLVLPITRVGIYVPGGQAAYPSTVLMNAIPPLVAGVSEIAMCVPAQRSGEVNSFTLVAASEVGIEEIYKVGGAQAIAAMAYGTESIRRVDKICGPGNIYVTLAKKMVMGEVGIDMLAGPSEILVLADEKASPRFIAADMLAQAEHDPRASAFLVTHSEELAEAVKLELEHQVEELERGEIARQSLQENGRIFVLDSLEVATKLVNAIAPEHLELAVANPRRLLSQIRNAGAIFLGSYSPEAVGDYVAGPNHVLPTAGTARFSSPLNPDDFVKKSSIISYSKESLRKAAPLIEEIAAAEGLEAHARSVSIRLEKTDDASDPLSSKA